MAYGIFMALMGAGLAFIAFRDYDWFMNGRSPYWLKKLFGRKGARIVYIILGMILVLGGVMYAADAAAGR